MTTRGCCNTTPPLRVLFSAATLHDGRYFNNFFLLKRFEVVLFSLKFAYLSTNAFWTAAFWKHQFWDMVLKSSCVIPLCNVTLHYLDTFQATWVYSWNFKLGDNSLRVTTLKAKEMTRIRSSSDALDFARVCELNGLQDLSHWASKQYLSTPFGRHSSPVDLKTIVGERSRLVNSTRNVLRNWNTLAFISQIIKCYQ